MFCCLYNQERDTLNNSVVQSSVSANPGLTLYMLLIKANPELVLICKILNIQQRLVHLSMYCEPEEERER